MGKRGPERDDAIESVVVQLRSLKGWTYEEIGKTLGFSKQRAHSIYMRWKKESYARMNDWLNLREK